jgi:23S rRNA pseudouridine1911/1915/1917 synthase
MDWTVRAIDAGIRLGKFLAARDRLGSHGRAAAAIARGKVFVNDVEATASGSRLNEGDVVRVWADRPGSSRRRPRAAPPGDRLAIVFEDDAIIVVNKPPGVLSVPLSDTGDLSVSHQLEDHLRPRGKQHPLVVHRIDRDTSGLVVFARHTRAQEHLKEQFKRHQPERVYLAVVYGVPDPPAGTWRDRLVWDSEMLIQKETHPNDPRGKEAISEYRVLESFGTTSLLEIRLHTGKRNQIRIQARLRGHTLVGEKRYVFGPEHLRSIRFRRQALHASRLAFVHPVDGRPMRFEAPVPDDLETLLRALRKAAPARAVRTPRR